MKKSPSIIAIAWLSLFCFSTQTFAQANGVGSGALYSKTIGNPTGRGNAAWNFKIPSKWGRETEVFKNSRIPGTPPVIYIQDAHCEYGAQKSIAALIEKLSRKYKAIYPEGKILIALEGASQPLDVQSFHPFAASEAGRQVNDFYVRKGLLSGAELAALNLGSYVSVLGIETDALYRENRRFYQEASQNKAAAVALIQRLKARLESEKRKIYSPGLLQVDQTENQFYSGRGSRIGLLDYVGFLIKQESALGGEKKPWQKKYPHLWKLEKIRLAEERIDFTALNAEIEQILTALKRNPKYRPAKWLLRWVEVKKSSDYAAFLKKLLAHEDNNAFNFRGYPQIRRYEKYLRLADDMAGMQVFDELEVWTEEIKNALYRSPLEKQKNEEGRLLIFAEKTALLEASRPELETVESARGTGKIQSELEALLQPAFDFYAAAKRRDQALFENLKSRAFSPSAKSGEAPLVFLVTGGFHSEALGDLFRKDEIPYRMLAPRFQRGSEESPYSGLMNGRNSPLEEIAGAFQQDAAKALERENRLPVRLPDGRNVFYRFRFNSKALNPGLRKTAGVELLESEFSAGPFTGKNAGAPLGDWGIRESLGEAIRQKDYRRFKSVFVRFLEEAPLTGEGKRVFGKINETLAQQAFEDFVSSKENLGGFMRHWEAAEKKAVLGLFKEREQTLFADRIKTIHTRKRKFLETLAGGYSAAQAIENLLSRAPAKLAPTDRQGLPDQAADRGPNELALEPFLSEDENRFEFWVAHVLAARQAQPDQADSREIALAASLGDRPLRFEDSYNFQDLVDTMRQKFDLYYFQSESGAGPIPEFEAETDFLQYVYALAAYSLEDVLEAFVQIRTVLGYEKDFVRSAAPILTVSGTSLDETAYDRKIQKLDEAAADVAIHVARGRVLKRFQPIDFTPELLDPARSEVYEEGVTRLMGLLQAYSEIASRPGWAHNYDDERNRSVLDPVIAANITTHDMLGNLRTIEKAAEETLKLQWASLKHEDRMEVFRMLESSHYAYLAVHRLIHEIRAEDFPKMRAALEKQGTEDARRLLSYITEPPADKGPAAQSLGIEKFEKLERAYQDLAAGRIVEGYRFAANHPGWFTADGTFYPSALNEISSTLNGAGLKPGDKFLDLGSGDGRVVLAAAYLFGAEAHGYETDQKLREVSEAMLKHLARPETQADFDAARARFFADTFLSDKADWSQYDVIYYYDQSMEFQKAPELFEKFKAKIGTMKPGARLIIHHEFTFNPWQFPFLQLTGTLQLTERSRPTQIYRVDEGQKKAQELGINPALVAPGMRFDEKGVGFPSDLHSRERRIRWWLSNHELGNKPTNEGVRAMAATGETRLRDEYRIYFVGKVPDAENDGWYAAHQILHDIFLTTLTTEQRREFFYLLKSAYDDYVEQTPRRASGLPSILYFLVDEKILDDSQEDPMKTFRGLIYSSEVFARLGGHYLGSPYPPDTSYSYDYHEAVFRPFFEKINLKAASLGQESAETRGPAEFFELVTAWNERYRAEGGHLAFQKQNINMMRGMGSVMDFDFLKQVMRVLLKNENFEVLDKDWIVSAEEFEKILARLAQEGLLLAGEDAELREAYEFLDLVSGLYVRNGFSGPLEPAYVEHFLSALAKARNEPPVTRDNVQERLNGFYKEFYQHASIVFEAVTRITVDLYGRRFAPVYNNERALDQHFMVRRREGFRFSLKRGFVEESAGEIHLQDGMDPDAFYAAHPELFFRVFEHATIEQFAPSQEILKALKRNLNTFTEFLASEKGGSRSPELQTLHDSFLNILRIPRNISYTFWRLHHLKILDVYLPHYARIRNLFTEMVHRFSVDMHTMYNIELLEGLAEAEDASFARAREIYRRILGNPERIMTLRLGLLFHDIGKGLYSPFGPGHAVTGAQDIVPPALAGMGLRAEPMRQAAWLVRYHMVLNAFAERVKDHPEELFPKTLELLSDPGINQFLLDGLFAMSFADKFAVDPERRELLLSQGSTSPLAALDQLHLAASEILAHPANWQQAFENFQSRIRQEEVGFTERMEKEIKEKLLSGIYVQTLEAYLPGVEEEFKTPAILEKISQGFLDDDFHRMFSLYASLMPANYLRTLDTEKIMRQLVFLRHLEILKEEGIRTPLVLFAPFHYQHERFYEVLVGFAQDEPGLLAKITGVLTANGIDIHGAEVNTSREGIGLDRFFGFVPGGEVDFAELEKRIRIDLEYLFSGRITTQELLSVRREKFGFEKKISGVLDRAPHIQFESNAEIDGVPVSVLTIEMIDREGLLYAVTDALANRFGINVVKVSASTYNFLAKDTFFVSKAGRPLDAQEQQETGQYLFELFGRQVIYGASLGSEREAPEIEQWVFLGRGEAVVEAVAVEKTPLDASALNPAIQELERIVNSLSRRTQPGKMLGERVVARLKELAGQSAIHGFDEIRWADDSNLFAFTSPEFIALGRGYFYPDLFTVKEQSRILFYIGLRHLITRDNTLAGYEPEKALQALENKIFGSRSAFDKKLEHFRLLSDPKFLNAAVDRFEAFEAGSPYYGTFNLFKAWAEADMRKQELLVLKQAAYLMKAFFASPDNTKGMETAAAGSFGEEHFTMDEIRFKNKELVLKTYVRVVLPLHALGIFRTQWLEAMDSIRNSLLKDLEEEARMSKVSLDRINREASLRAYYQRADSSPFGPMVALLVSLPGPFPQSGFTAADLSRHYQQYNELAKMILIRPEWLNGHWSEIKQRREEAAEQRVLAKDILVPGDGWKNTVQIAFHFELLTMQGWNDWSHVLNSALYEATGFGLQKAKDVRGNASVKVVTLDAIPTGSMFYPRTFIQIAHNRPKDSLVIQRQRQTVVRDLVHWSRGEFSFVSTRNESFHPLIHTLLKLRANLTAPTINTNSAEAAYSWNGVDLLPWVGAMLRVAAVNDLAFWPAVKLYYGKVSPFIRADGRGKLTEEDIALFWYYNIFSHPEGVFAWLAGRHPEHREPLRYVEGGNRLTDDSARNFLDTLMGLYWSWPMAGDLASAKTALFEEFLRYVRFEPNGIFVRNPGEFEQFLTRDLKTAMPSLKAGLADFQRWRSERFPQGLDFNRPITRPTVLSEVSSGETKVVPQTDNTFYGAAEIAPKNFLVSENWPWPQSLEPSLAAYVTEYQNGITIPAPEGQIAFRYKIEGVANGTKLIAGVVPGESMIIQPVEHEGRRPVYVKLDLPAARTGFIPPQPSWTRVPVVAPGQDPSRFYEVTVADDGLFVLRLGQQVALVTTPALAGKKLLVQIHAGTLVLYDTAETAYVGTVSFNGGVQIKGHSVPARILPPLAASVRDNHFQTVAQHSALEKISNALASVMKLGLGYQKIVIFDESEIRLEKDKIFLPRSYLETPDKALADVGKTLDSQDPIRKLEKHVAALNALEKSTAIFNKDFPIPDNPEAVDAETFQSWPDASRREYAKLADDMKSIHQRLVVMRNIGTHRKQFGDMGAERLRKTLSSLLRSAPEDFLFVTPSGNIYRALKSLQTPQRTYLDHDGAGYITDQFYKLDSEHDLVLEDRLRPSAESGRRLIFVRFKKDGKMALLLFDTETGELFDEEKNRLSTELAQLDETVPLLKTVPGLKDELQKALGRMESMSQQIELLEQLQKSLPGLLGSSFPQINEAMLRLVLAAVAREGVELVRSFAKFSSDDLTRHRDELELLLMHFNLHPEDNTVQKNPAYSQRFQSFVSDVLLPLARSSWKDAPDFSDPLYFEKLTGHMTGIQHQIQALWDLESIRVEGGIYKWDGPMAQRFSLAARETDEPNSIQQYFMKLGPGEETPVEVETEASTPEEKKMSHAERQERATHLTFLGGVEGIGASSMELAYQGKETPDWTRIIVDAGVYLDEVNTPPAYRFLRNTPNAVFLTHSHMDHVGSAVFLFKRLGKKVPFYATRGTVELLRITLYAMVRDNARKAEDYSFLAQRFFTEAEVEEFLKHITPVDPVYYDEDKRPVYPVLEVSPKMKVQFHHAGHLHGAASLIVITPDGNTLVSGDVSIRGQGSVPGFKPWHQGMPPIHTVISESTYGMTERDSEEVQEEKLIQVMIKVLQRGGKVLFPAYANGRAPRILDILLRRMDQFPPDIQRKLKIYVDGIAASFIEAYQKVYPELRDSRIELVGNKFKTPKEGYEYREGHILSRKGPSIIIASSANLQGMSAWYGEKLAGDERNAFFFTGYMDPLEPASAVMDVAKGDSFVFREGRDPVAVQADRESFKLSGHAAGSEILETLEQINRGGVEPSLAEKGTVKRVIFVHGSAKARSEMIKTVKELPGADDWHPIDTGVGQKVLSVAVLDNREGFQSIPAIPLAKYTAASLGMEKANHVYHLLGSGRVRSLNPHFIESFLARTGMLPKIGGEYEGTAGLYVKAQKIIKKFGMFFIHGNVILDTVTGKAILLIGSKGLGKSLVSDGLMREAGSQFQFVSDSNAMAMIYDGRLYAGPAAHYDPKVSILPPVYRDKAGQLKRYAMPSRGNYRFFEVEAVVHFLKNQRTLFSKTTEGIDTEDLFQTLTAQIPEFATREDRVGDLTHFVSRQSIVGLTVDVPEDRDRRNYAEVVETIKRIVDQGGEAERPPQAQSLGGFVPLIGVNVHRYIQDQHGNAEALAKIEALYQSLAEKKWLHARQIDIQEQSVNRLIGAMIAELQNYNGENFLRFFMEGGYLDVCCTQILVGMFDYLKQHSGKKMELHLPLDLIFYADPYHGVFDSPASEKKDVILGTVKYAIEGRGLSYRIYDEGQIAAESEAGVPDSELQLVIKLWSESDSMTRTLEREAAPSAQSLGTVPAVKLPVEERVVSWFDPGQAAEFSPEAVRELAADLDAAFLASGREKIIEEIERLTGLYIQKITREHETAVEAKLKSLEAKLDEFLVQVEAVLRNGAVDQRREALASVIQNSLAGEYDARTSRILADYFHHLDILLNQIRELSARESGTRTVDLQAVYAKMPGQSQTKTFLSRVFPAEAHLAVIFAVSDEAAPYSLLSQSYRQAVRTVLESNPLAVIRIAHTGSPDDVKQFQREFAQFGARIQIESASREHLPFVLNGFLSDDLLNQVKSLSGQTRLKKTELTQHISVVADEEILNQFQKIALGGKELVSLIHSKLLDSRDPALMEGAMLFEWGMAHFVAFQQADEIRREIGEEELTIRGNRFIPNEAGLGQFLASLGEAWQGIQQMLRAA